MKKKVIIASVVFVVIAGILLGFAFIKRNKNNVPKYKTEAIEKGDIEALVVASGTLNPVTVVDVGSQVSGRIANLYADFNSPVREGQVVAELDQSIFISRVEQNEANYESSVAALEKANVTYDNAKKRYERALTLFEKDLISYEDKDASETQYYSAKTDVQSAEARLQQAKSQLESSKIDLAYTVIRSPVDGFVISRNVNVGQTVTASLQAPVLFKIANDLSKMQVECNIDEADIGKIKDGQKVRFTVDAFPQDAFTGKVTQVRYSPEIVQNVVTYTTIVDVDNPEMKLRPGMTATVSIITGEARDVLKVSNAALRFTPPLSQKEMEELFRNLRETMMAKRQAGGGPEGTGQKPAFQRAAGGSPGSFQPPGGNSQSRSGRSQQPSRVWIEDQAGKLSPVFIRPGVTDNTYTEIVWGDLKEGQLVITGMEGGSSSRSSSQSGPPGGMMFIRR